ncbi:hypothetical protein K488DRAFT_6834, partial [Vararia minispora EC-137]
HCPPPCSTNNFKIDCRGSPRSPWNQAVSVVFVDFMMQAGEFQDTNQLRNTLRTFFFCRMKSLQKAWRESNLAPHDQEMRAALHRREERQRGLFERRWGVVSDYPDIFPDLRRLLNRLGPNGMSDDETDVDENGRPTGTYTVFRLPWRHPDLRAHFIMLDTIASGLR